MDILVTCKYEEDPIKNEGARVVTPLYSNFSEAPCMVSFHFMMPDPSVHAKGEGGGGG